MLLFAILAMIILVIVSIYVFIVCLCGGFSLIAMGIVLIAKRKTMLKSLKTIHKEIIAIALIVLGALIVTFLIFHLFLDQFESSAYNLYVLIKNIDEFMVTMSPIFGIIAFIVILLVIGIRTALKLKTINDPDIRSGKRFQAVLLIISGTVTAAVLSAFLILDSYVQKTLPMTTGLDQHMLKYYSEHTKAVAVLDLVIVAITAALWIFGIRTTVKLKNIDDVGIYNKKLIRATTLIIFGVLGTVISFILLKRDIHDCYFWLNCLIDIIKRYS